MNYIAFILLGILTMFYGNKQLQQLVLGLFIALGLCNIYVLIYEEKRYIKQIKRTELSIKQLEKTKKIKRIPNDIKMQRVGSGLVTFPSGFEGIFYKIKIHTGEIIAVHEEIYCMLTESSNMIFLQTENPITAYELAAGESMIIDIRRLAASSSSLICEGKLLRTLHQISGKMGKYEEKIIGPGRLWLTDTPIKDKEES